MSDEAVTSVVQVAEEESTISARRQAILILEVLAGTRSVPAAAAELGVSVNRYYQIEERGSAGWVGGCTPRPCVRSREYEQEVRRLEREKQLLQDECTRYQALVRATQRSVGIDAEEAQRHALRPTRRVRKPVVRALRAVERLQIAPDGNAPNESEA